MRFYPNPPPFYCGMDVHARSMYVCIVSQEGELLWHRHMKAAPEPCLKAMAPQRDGLVVAGACLFTWQGLADLGADPGIPFVLGHALQMNALQGAKPNTTKSLPKRIAARLRGGGSHRPLRIQLRGVPPATACGAGPI